MSLSSSFGQQLSRAGLLVLWWSWAWLPGSGCAGSMEAQSGPQKLGQIAEEATLRGEELDLILRETFLLLRSAREEGAETKIRCIGDKLTLMKGLLEVVHHAVIVTQDAASRGERERAELGLTKIRLAQARVGLVRRAVAACPEEILVSPADPAAFGTDPAGTPLPEAPGSAFDSR